MWTEPDVVSHVEDRGDYRLHNLFEKLIINAEIDKIGDYKYDTTGLPITKIEVYDVSCPALMENYMELRDECDTYEMDYRDEYKTPTIAYDQYSNVTLSPLILLMNNKYTNADFVLDDSESYRMLDSHIVMDLLCKSESQNQPNNVQEVNDPDEYEQHMKKLNMHRDDHDPTLDRLFSNKFNISMKEVENTLGYKQLVHELGESEVKKNIMKLTSYFRKE